MHVAPRDAGFQQKAQSGKTGCDRYSYLGNSSVVSCNTIVFSIANNSLAVDCNASRFYSSGNVPKRPIPSSIWDIYRDADGILLSVVRGPQLILIVGV